MFLTYRKKTGCKQYVHKSLSEVLEYFNKKCYDGETIKIFEYDDVTRKELNNYIFKVWHHQIRTVKVDFPEYTQNSEIFAYEEKFNETH